MVEDLAGRGRTVLPADYLAEHCEYGWASTIDAAQGATADVGIVLVRPGMDREHLYVAMTRGRTSNHAYLTPDPSSAGETCEHATGHGPGRGHDGTQRPAAGPAQRQASQQEAGNLSASPAMDVAALRVLEAALATNGAQDAAHTALSNARDTAVTAARRAARAQAAVEAVERARADERAQAPSPEHKATREQLQVLQQQRKALTAGQEQTRRTLREVREELEAPRWARPRRRGLAHRLTPLQTQQAAQAEESLRLDTQIQQTERRLETLDRDRTARRTTRPVAPVPAVTGAPDLLGTLATPTRTGRPERAGQPGGGWTPGTWPGWRPLRQDGTPAPDPHARTSGRGSWTDSTWPAAPPSREQAGGLGR